MKKQNRFWAVVLILSLCLALALPAVAAGSPRLYETYDLTGIPEGYDYHAVSGEVSLAGGTTVTITGTWSPPNAQIWVGIVNRSGSNARSVLLKGSGDTQSFTVPETDAYVLQVSSPNYNIHGGSLLVQW